MSRSRRKTPIGGNGGASSEKKDKKEWHGRMRAKERDKLKTLIEPDEHITTLREDVSNLWDMSKDGKQYYTSCLDETWLKEQYYIDHCYKKYRYNYIFNKQLFKIAIRLLPITKECRKYINKEKA